MVISPWLPILPGLAIMVTVLAINLAADGWPTRSTLACAAAACAACCPLRRRRAGAARTVEVRPKALLRVHGLHVEFPSSGASCMRCAASAPSSPRPHPRHRRRERLGQVGDRAVDHRAARPARTSHQRNIHLDGVDLVGSPRPDGQVARAAGGDDLPESRASLSPVLTIGYQMTESLRRQRAARRRRGGSTGRPALRRHRQP